MCQIRDVNNKDENNINKKWLIMLNEQLKKIINIFFFVRVENVSRGSNSSKYHQYLAGNWRGIHNEKKCLTDDDL